MRRFLVWVCVLASSSQAFAQLADGGAKAEGCRVVVLNLVGKNLPDSDKDVPGLLTETLANEVNIASGCQVVTQADVAQMLDFEAAKAACTEGADSCLSEIGSALGAERVVGGSLGRLGNDFIINARLMNVKSGSVEARAEQVVPGAVEKLRLAAKNVGRQLFGKPLTTDDSPVVKEAPIAPPPDDGVSPMFVVGASVAGLGLVTAAVGGVLAGVAESQLSDPAQIGKDDVIGEGQVAVAVVGVGVAVAVVGAALLVVPMIVE